jgi:light-harvesting complex I chlorophyll a/b binding protein 5
VHILRLSHTSPPHIHQNKNKTKNKQKAARVVRAAAANADRPLWFPGNPAPAHLDGSLAGDYGFDPLNLGAEPETLKWMVQAELQNGRWAMLGVAGILFTSLGAEAGLNFPQWYDAGKVAIANSPFSFQTLLGVQFLLFAWVETKRFLDFKNPGSQVLFVELLVWLVGVGVLFEHTTRKHAPLHTPTTLTIKPPQTQKTT